MGIHKAEWTDETIQNFWNAMEYLTTNGMRANDYFALLGGKDLMRIVENRLHFHGKIVLDYGCGLGILTEELLKHYNPTEVCACDISRESVNATRKKCEKYANFTDAYVINGEEMPLEDGKFDIVFVTEIVEHLSDDALKFLMNQVHRLLKRGGRLVVTTPNEENLARNVVVCPECGCYYHRMQHVRSWTKDTLTEAVNQYGFRKLDVVTTTLYERNSLKRKIFAEMYNLLLPLLGKKPGNLIYIAEKT